jgi:hypothetical protein
MWVFGISFPVIFLALNSSDTITEVKVMGQWLKGVVFQLANLKPVWSALWILTYLLFPVSFLQCSLKCADRELDCWRLHQPTHQKEGGSGEQLGRT